MFEEFGKDKDGNMVDLISRATVAVIQHFKWGPEVISRLHSDRQDHLGLFFWYDYVKAVTGKK